MFFFFLVSFGGGCACTFHMFFCFALCLQPFFVRKNGLQFPIEEGQIDMDEVTNGSVLIFRTLHLIWCSTSQNNTTVMCHWTGA